MDKYLKDFKNLKKGELAVLIGAGTSKPSGLPLANEVKQYILLNLGVNNHELSLLMDSQLPFESFMEVISENSDIKPIVKMFSIRNTNPNYILLAKLVKSGYLNCIVTTNFDVLIEKALDLEGIKNYQVFCDENEFETMLDLDSDVVKIIKIHGSVQNIASIRTTLKDVANKLLSTQRQKIIEHLFASGKHQKVLIMGYSCSDVFDISPHIEGIKKSKKRVIFIDHNENQTESSEAIKVKEFKNPFKKFNGKRIYCNTSNFIKQMFSYINERCEIPDRLKDQSEWKSYIDLWSQNTEEAKKHFINGSLLMQISENHKSVKYFQKSLSIWKQQNYLIGISASLVELGHSQSELGYYKKGVNYYKKALKISNGIMDPITEFGCYTGICSCLLGLGQIEGINEYYDGTMSILHKIENKNFKLNYEMISGSMQLHLRNYPFAFNHFNRALVLAQNVGAKIEEAQCYSNLGEVLLFLNKLDRAEKCCVKSLELNKMLGFKRGELLTNITLGNIYREKKDFPRAVDFLYESLEIAKQLKSKAELAKIYSALGTILAECEKYELAVPYFELTLSFAKETHNKEMECSSYVNLGVCIQKNGDPSEAIKYHTRASIIANQTRNREVEGKCLLNLAVCYSNRNDFVTAIVYQEKALEIFKQISSYLNIGMSYNNLGIYNSSSHRYKEAVKCFKLAERYFKKIKRASYLLNVYYNLVINYRHLKDEKNCGLYKEKLSEVLLQVKENM